MDNIIDNTGWVDAITPTHRDIDWYKDLLIESNHNVGYIDDGLVVAFFETTMWGIRTGARAERLDMVLHNVKRARAVMQACNEVRNGDHT